MYLTNKQHELLRNLLMNFEVPYRAFIARRILSKYNNGNEFVEDLKKRAEELTPSDPALLRYSLPKKDIALMAIYDCLLRLMQMRELK